MKRLFLAFLLLLASCNSCAHFSTPSCDDWSKAEFEARAKAGLQPAMRQDGDNVVMFIWLNPKTLELDGLGFLLPEAPEYSKEPIGLPNETEIGYCKDGEKDVRIVGFRMPSPQVNETGPL